MRVVWRDSSLAKEYKPIKYRDYEVCGSPRGWTTSIPGDDNIYKNHYSALNAIDAAMGGENPKGPPTEKRKRYGIQVIGKKDETA